MEENQADVMQEVAAPEQENVSGEFAENTPVANEALPQEDVSQNEIEDPQEKNWRELRQTLKEFKNENNEIRRENQFLAQKLMELEGGKQTQNVEEEVDDEELVTYKTLKKYEQKLNQKFQQAEASTAIDRVKARFGDFEEVVTAENVEYLKKNEPELVASLQAMKSDPYGQAVAAYKLLKRTDFYLNKENSAMKKRAEQNIKKPVSVNAAKTQGALGDAHRFANGLTPDLKKALWQEMQEARKLA